MTEQQTEEIVENNNKYFLKIIEHKNPGYGSHWHAELKMFHEEVKIERAYFDDLMHELGHVLLALTNELHHSQTQPE